MLKRRLLIVALVMAAALAAAWWAVTTFSPVVTLELSRDQIQAQLAPRFPAEKCLLHTVCLALREPRLQLDEGSDRIGLAAQFTATLGQRAMPGTVAFTGRPRYDAGTGSFYLDDVQVSQFQMSGNAPDFDEVVRVRGPGIMAAILHRVPLYTLKPDTTRGELARLALRSVQVVDGKLRLTLLNPLGAF